MSATTEPPAPICGQSSPNADNLRTCSACQNDLVCHDLGECRRLERQRDQLRLDVAELTGRLKERQMVAHEQEKGLLEQVRGMRTVADEALVLLETLSDYFDSTAERKGGKWWEWKESARRLRDQIASWRLRLNARPTPTGDSEGGAA